MNTRPKQLGHSGHPRFGEMAWFHKWLVMGDCWESRGRAVTDGYSQVQINGKTKRLHRAMWELLVGPIPDGMTIDHICRNRGCCNPDHLRVMTQKENNESSPAYRATRSKKDWSVTHCDKGHEWSDESTYVASNGHRFCRTCNRDSKRRGSNWKGGEGQDWRKGKVGGLR